MIFRTSKIKRLNPYYSIASILAAMISLSTLNEGQTQPNSAGLTARESDTLGLKYLTGEGVRQDSAKAYELFSQAAEDGYAIAELHLAKMLEAGKGVRKDPKRAFDLTKRSALRGFTEAQNHLGWMYQKGIGTQIDSASAVRWFRRAAENGSAAAKYNLGVSYEKGVGVKADPSTALGWFHKAAQGGDPNAQFMLGVFYTLGVGLRQDLTQGHKWFQQAGEPSRWGQISPTAHKFQAASDQRNTSVQKIEWWLRNNLSKGTKLLKSTINDWMP